MTEKRAVVRLGGQGWHVLAAQERRTTAPRTMGW